jgi:hypothetical protein
MPVAIRMRMVAARECSGFKHLDRPVIEMNIPGFTAEASLPQRLTLLSISIV